MKTAFSVIWLDISVDRSITPSWSSKIQRWYQLDNPAYVLAEFANQIRSFKSPDLVVLSGNGASNSTDLAFVGGDSPRPSTFVHTLPNVRFSSFSELLSWNGPMICLGSHPHSHHQALVESYSIWKKEPSGTIWSLFLEEKPSSYRVTLTPFSPTPLEWENTSKLWPRASSSDSFSPLTWLNDEQLRNHIEAQSEIDLDF